MCRLEIVGNINCGNKQVSVLFDLVGFGWNTDVPVGLQQAFDMECQNLTHPRKQMVEGWSIYREPRKIGKRGRVRGFTISLYDRDENSHCRNSRGLVSITREVSLSASRSSAAPQRIWTRQARISEVIRQNMTNDYVRLKGH